MPKDMYDYMEEMDIEGFKDKFVWVMEELAINPWIPLKAFDEVN